MSEYRFEVIIDGMTEPTAWFKNINDALLFMRAIFDEWYKEGKTEITIRRVKRETDSRTA